MAYVTTDGSCREDCRRRRRRGPGSRRLPENLAQASTGVPRASGWRSVDDNGDFDASVRRDRVSELLEVTAVATLDSSRVHILDVDVQLRDPTPFVRSGQSGGTS